MTEESSTNSIGTWGALVGVVGGAALGYWAGRSSENNCGCGCNNNCGCGFNGYASPWGAAAFAANGFNEFEAGKTQAKLYAGLDYVGNAVAATRRDIGTLTTAMNAQFQRIEDRQFDMLIAENTALKGELNTSRTILPITNQMTGMNATLNTIDRAFHPGYVSAVPLCNRCNTCTCMLSA